MSALASLRVLVVDDEDDVRMGIRLLAESLGAQVRDVESGERALETVRSWSPHLMLTDINMKGMSGMEVLRETRRLYPDVRVLMITGFGTIELTVEAMRSGAVNFITKPFDNEEILREVRRHGEEALVAERIRERTRSPAAGPLRLIAEDPEMKQVLELVDQVAPTGVPVLIRGESGTGKELIARLIHHRGRNPGKPFLAVNSAALPDTLLESELFGHSKGAFTGADGDREGIFAQARGGTVFLDEIGLMSPAFQTKLLRVLQEHTVIPLGTSIAKPVDFRLISATNRSLREGIDEGTFRKDLYYRLQVVTLDVPPLRNRPGDILPLATHFLVMYAEQTGMDPGGHPGFSTGALEVMKKYDWPGNVRELENSIQRALILSKGGEIQSIHLHLGEDRLPWDKPGSGRITYEEGKQEALRSFRRVFIERALTATGGNVTRAAERCGLTRAAFQRIMRDLDLDRTRFVQ